MVLGTRDLEAIEEVPLEDEVEQVRELYGVMCKNEQLPVHPRFLQSFDPTDRWSLILLILSGLQNHPCARALRSRGLLSSLRSELLAIEVQVDLAKLEVHAFKNIIRVFIAVKVPSDPQVWNAAFALVGTPGEEDNPAEALDDDDMDAMQLDDGSDTEPVLEVLPEALFIDIPNFHDEKFGRRCNGLEALSAEIYGECCHGENPLFADGQWLGWPADATPDALYTWLDEFFKALSELHDARGGHAAHEPRFLSRPAPDPNAEDGALPVTIKDTWDNTLLVVGLVHQDPAFDNRQDAWRPLNNTGLYKLTYVEDRRFIFGFTLCGPLMRVWCISPITGAASLQFNIHEDGERLVYTFLGFLLMQDQALGFS